MKTNIEVEKMRVKNAIKTREKKHVKLLKKNLMMN